MVIGQCDLRNGVYVFASVPASALVANIDPLVLHQRDNSFDETVFPFAVPTPSSGPPPILTPSPVDFTVAPVPITPAVPSTQQPSPSPVIPAVPATQQPTQQSPSPSQSPSESSTPSASSDDDDNPESSSVETTSPSPILPSLPPRTRRRPSHLNDYVLNSAKTVTSAPVSSCSSQSGTRFPITNFVHYSKLQDSTKSRIKLVTSSAQ
ncbi:unnamed protein product [Cuscuta campestris]|uniref:Uncharacterized protein n=1 Tax=Cuscuta campestris TaxID=132261 RepID=A0A484LJQ1_9ASTE|nr:unnamed protein product [Cuscuta campestris]